MKPSKLLSLLLSLALAVFFLSAAVAIPILYRPFYYEQIESLALAEQTGWSEAVIRQAYDEVMDYLVADAPFGTGELKWSASGMQHFADCKVLFRLDFILLGCASLLLLALALLRWRRKIAFHRFAGRSPAFWAAAGMALVFALAALWALIDFNSLFTAFHSVFFPGKTNWLFDEQADQIIQILPEVFWVRTGAFVLTVSLGGAVLTAAAAALLRKHDKP
ncbi:MAG: TIGR01906 family membrane protein [Eubacteriales bacterium]|nr:TIGR01906 family membrane protein [Eubacteriales bacterium]